MICIAMSVPLIAGEMELVEGKKDIYIYFLKLVLGRELFPFTTNNTKTIAFTLPCQFPLFLELVFFSFMHVKII